MPVVPLGVAELLPEADADAKVVPLGPVPPVALVMGSQSDWGTLRHAAATLEALGVEFEARIVSAHRTPKRLYDFAAGARARGVQVIIAGAGGAAHLPGMVAALTPLPVLGVPVESKTLGGLDSLLSIVQMPAGVPVGTLAIGRAGAINAALLACAVLALGDAALAARLEAWREAQTDAVGEIPLDLADEAHLPHSAEAFAEALGEVMAEAPPEGGPANDEAGA